MEQLADNIKTKSLTEALELLTDQVSNIATRNTPIAAVGKQVEC